MVSTGKKWLTKMNCQYCKGACIKYGKQNMGGLLPKII